jgi:hypothetical protein
MQIADSTRAGQFQELVKGGVGRLTGRKRSAVNLSQGAYPQVAVPVTDRPAFLTMARMMEDRMCHGALRHSRGEYAPAPKKTSSEAAHLRPAGAINGQVGFGLASLQSRNAARLRMARRVPLTIRWRLGDRPLLRRVLCFTDHLWLRSFGHGVRRVASRSSRHDLSIDAVQRGVSFGTAPSGV